MGLNSIPLWITLPGLPLHLWGSTTLSRICSVLGKPLHADSCTMRKERVMYARVCIEFSSSESLKDSIKIVDDEGNVFFQQVIYDWKPPNCLLCQVFGHSSDACKPPSPPQSCDFEDESGPKPDDHSSLDPSSDPALCVPAASSPPEGTRSSRPSPASPVVGVGDPLSPATNRLRRPFPADTVPTQLPLRQPRTARSSTFFSFPSKRHLARRTHPPILPVSGIKSTNHSDFSSPNRFETLPPGLDTADPPVLPPLDSLPVVDPSDPSFLRPVSLTSPSVVRPVLDNAKTDQSPSLPSLSHSCLNLRPQSSLCLSSSGGQRKHPPPSSLAGQDVHPRPSAPYSFGGRNLFAKFSDAKSLACNAVISGRPDSLLREPPPPPKSFPSPSLGPNLPASLLCAPSLDPETGALVSATDDAEDDSDPPFVDPMYLEKSHLLESSSGDEDGEQDEALNNRTKFHWEEASPPKMFRKTPHRS